MYHPTMVQRAWQTLGPLWLVGAVTSALAHAQSDAAANGCDGLLGVRSMEGYRHVWSETIEFRQMEEACRSSDNAPFYWQLRGMAENLLGNQSESG